MQEISAEVGISAGSIHNILLCQYLLPKMLTPEHKET
jgi:hypothetical protein